MADEKKILCEHCSSLLNGLSSLRMCCKKAQSSQYQPQQILLLKLPNNVTTRVKSTECFYKVKCGWWAADGHVTRSGKDQFPASLMMQKISSHSFKNHRSDHPYSTVLSLGGGIGCCPLKEPAEKLFLKERWTPMGWRPDCSHPFLQLSKARWSVQ